MSIDLSLPGPDLPVVDSERLLAEFGGCEEILNELRDLFLEHAPPMYDSILSALASGDAVTLAKDAHSFKGACATYGAPRLCQVCKIFELSAKAGDLESLKPLVENFKQEYEAVCRELGKVAV